MSTLAEIKAATTTLSIDQRLELSRWLDEFDDTRARHMEELRRQLDIGLEQARRGELLTAAEVFPRLRTRAAEIAQT